MQETLPSIKSRNDLPSSPGSTRNKSNDINENPFKIPNDDRIFKLKEEEKLKKQDIRIRNLEQPIWEKTNNETLSRTKRLKDLLGDDNKLNNLSNAMKNINDDNIKIIAPRNQEKENMTEFVAKKKEMFLVQMSLDTKREEIRKLEEKAQMKEEALQRSEQMLEEDAMRFDAFLKENDKKAHDAIKKAEEETKKKQEKTQEIKKYTQQIQSLNSEMSKHKEALEDCLRYKNFLDQLTPPEWFEKHKQSLIDKQNKIRNERYQEKYKVWEKLRKKLIEQHRKELEIKKELKKERNRRLGKIEEEDDDEPESKVVIPPAPRLEDEIVEMPEEEVPMFFKDPQQLMDIFSALEEQDLFLIQNGQETERSLEELQHIFKETKISMDFRTSQLDEQIYELKQQIALEEARMKLLLNKNINSLNVDISNETTQNQIEKEKLLNLLNTKVRYVYEECGFDASSRPSTLFMLSQLESRLELLLTEIEKMPDDYIIKSEKEKEKKRRERKREEQQRLQERKQEERNKNAIERSMKAPKKRFGRQVMFRSIPVRKEEVNNGDDNDNGNNDDEAKYLS